MNSFDQFWDLYDKKTSKPKALLKWYRLPASEQQKIMEHIPKYKEQQPDRQFRKDPCTYLNNRSWEDTIYSKDEDTQTYKEPEPTKVSDYKVKPFDRATGIQHLRDKLKANYDNGGKIKDWGDVYTTILNDFIEIPGDVGVELHEREVTEASRKRNRFEDDYSGSVTANVRDARLNWMLDFWRKNGRKIYEEI